MGSRKQKGYYWASAIGAAMFVAAFLGIVIAAVDPMAGDFVNLAYAGFLFQGSIAGGFFAFNGVEHLAAAAKAKHEAGK